jgi:aryl-alcohol dehydrogenase-like predicted oxidoreductase
VPLADSLGEFDELAKAGKIRAIGLSQFTPSRLDEAMRTADANGLLKPCCLQTWYNMVEREKLEGELRDVAFGHGLGIFPFYSLANGFLTGKYRNASDLDKSPRGQRNAAYLEGRGMRVLGALDEVAAETGEALATVALAWTMAQPGIVAALASATGLDQLRELTAAMHLRLSADQLARQDAASAEAEPA